jgi:hypothetical protein
VKRGGLYGWKKGAFLDPLEVFREKINEPVANIPKFTRVHLSPWEHRFVHDSQYRPIAFVDYSIPNVPETVGEHSSELRHSSTLPSPVSPQQQSDTDYRRNGAVDRPSNLPGHETAGQHVNTLQKPYAAK